MARRAKPLGLLALIAMVGFWTAAFAYQVFERSSELGYEGAWASTFDAHSIPAMVPVFADLRTVTHGVECWVHGIDVYAIDPCDPWGRPTNYPPIWLETARALGADATWTVPIGVVFAIGFLCSAIAFFGRRPLIWHGIAYGLALTSPPMLLGIERGNPDIFIFTLLVIALFLVFGRMAAAFAATAIFVLATALKLFPICAAALLLVRGRRADLIALAVILVGAVYFTLNADYLASIGANTSRGTVLSFGAGVIFNGLAARFDWPELPNAALPVLLLVMAGAIGFGLFLSRRYPYVFNLVQDRSGGGFAIGAAIYLFSFAATSNWDYRLCFLLLCVPQWLDWASEMRAPRLQRDIAMTLLLAFIASAHLSNYVPLVTLYIDEGLNWIVFFLLATIVTLQAGRVIGDWRRYLAESA